MLFLSSENQGLCQTDPAAALAAFVSDGNGHIRHVLGKAAIGTLGGASRQKAESQQNGVRTHSNLWPSNISKCHQWMIFPVKLLAKHGSYCHVLIPVNLNIC